MTSCPWTTILLVFLSLTGFVIARPLVDSGQSGGIQTSFYHVMGSNKKKVKVYTRQANEAPTRMEFLRNKRFVVKVQLPIPGNSSLQGPLFKASLA